MMRSRRQLILAGLTALSLFAAFSLRATNTPVFRHALELWPASDYEIVVFHRGEMDPASQSLVDQLRISRAQTFANIDVKRVDVSGPMATTMEDLWTCQTNPLPPWVVVRDPDTSADASPVWSGRLTETMVAALLDSPARRKIAENLLRGATAVWILLESGEATRDEAAVDTLSAELKRLEKVLTLPAPAAGDSKLHSSLPMGIEFSLVRITRTDPAEEFLLTLLQHGKPPFSARPAAFAVYGRGRMLGALVGREIEADAIGTACASLVAACTHESKEQNPGRDLLLAANWNSIFNPAAAKNRAAAVLPANPPATPVNSGAPQPSAERPHWTPYVLLTAAVLGVAVVFVKGRRSRVRPASGSRIP